MRQQFTTATRLAALCGVLCILAPADAARARRACGIADNAPSTLHGAKRRHAVGHRRQVPQGAVALAGSVADEPRADPQSAPHLSGRRHQAHRRRWPAAARSRAQYGETVARNPGFTARSAGDPADPARRHRAVPDAAADHRSRRPRRRGRDRRRTRRARRPRPAATSSTRSASIRRPATSGSSTGRASGSSTAPAKRSATKTGSSAPRASSASPTCPRRASNRRPRRS